MSLYRIEVMAGDYSQDYIDPFTGEILEDEKHKVAMVCFLLADQNPGYKYAIKEVKKN